MTENCDNNSHKIQEESKLDTKRENENPVGSPNIDIPMTFLNVEKLDNSEKKDERANLVKPSPTHSEQYKKPLPVMSVESEFSIQDLEVDVENVNLEIGGEDDGVKEHGEDAKEPQSK